jgi:hypothetical protein
VAPFSVPPYFANSPRRSTQCGFDKLVWTILAFWASWAWSAPCLASNKPNPSPSPFPVTSAWLNQGNATADLDGDGRPDLATARAEGWGQDAFNYRIEVALTTQGGLSSFSVSSEEGGLRIVPRDVDGDGDLDLVISSARSHLPVGVWINDGHGGFTQGDPTAYSRSIWTDDPGISSHTSQEAFQATVPPSSRSWLVSSHESHFDTDLLFGRLPLLPAASSLTWFAVSQPRTRAPPRSLPEHSN